MNVDCDEYLRLLTECGIRVDATLFRSLHTSAAAAPASPELPTYDGLPVITRSDYMVRSPESYGINQYWVVEDEAAAHPVATRDPTLWNHLTFHRIHRYDRVYIFRRTLYHLLGLEGSRRHPADLLPGLAAHLKHRLHDADVYARTRAWLTRRALQPLYLSIPSFIQRLGGPTWDICHIDLATIENDFRRLHVAFNRYHPDLRRKRFPKMVFVVLALLAHHQIYPPYDLPWCKTRPHALHLRGLYNRLIGFVNQDLFLYAPVYQ